MYNDDFSGVFAIFGAFFGIMMLFIAIIYVISSLGYYKLYKQYSALSDKAWMAWVPFCNVYILGEFLSLENGLTGFESNALKFYWIGSFIPVVGGFVTLAGAIFSIVHQFKFMSKYNAPTLHYVFLFLFPIVLPYLWVKYFEPTYY